MFKFKKLIDKKKIFLKKINKSTFIFIFLLFCTIFAHILAFVLMKMSNGTLWFYGQRYINQQDLFNLTLDGGYFEHFQYILLLWCALLSTLVSLREFKYTFSIPFIYTFLFLDDAFSFHDYFHKSFIPILKKTFLSNQDIFRVKDFSEIIFWVIILIICLLLSTNGYKNGSKASKKFISINFRFFLILSFFGSFVDLINSNIMNWLGFLNLSSFQSWVIKNLGNFIEEIGEITVITCICVWLFRLASNRKLKLKELILFQR